MRRSPVREQAAPECVGVKGEETAMATNPLDLEAEYNNRARVTNSAALLEQRAAAGKTHRALAKADLDLVYGKDDRNRYDLFHAAGATGRAPLVAYIHGGYWQRGERQENAWVAKELTAKGVAVAVASYTLCPATTVTGIADEMRQFLKALWTRTRQYPVVVGHSAGGQLAAAMLAADWSKVDGVPADLVRAAYAISGVFELPPLVATSLNGALKLTPESARAASPLFGPSPRMGTRLVAAVGGDESQEFIRQSLDIADAWSRAGCTAECVVVPGANHFTILDALSNPDSAMVDRIAGLARAVATS